MRSTAPLRGVRRTLLSALRRGLHHRDASVLVAQALAALEIDARFVPFDEVSTDALLTRAREGGRGSDGAVAAFAIPAGRLVLECTRTGAPFATAELDDLEELAELLDTTDVCGVAVASTTLDRLGLGMAEMDAQGRFLSSNQTLRDLLGYAAEELTELDYQALTHDDHAESDAALHQSLLEGLPRAHLEKRVRHKTGRELWVAVTIERLERAAGAPSFLVTVRDVTTRRIAQRERDEAEARQRLFVEHAPVGIAVFDRAMRYLLVSDRFVDEYGLERAAVIGRSHYDVFPDIPERWRAIHRRCLGGAVERSDADAFPRADGSTDWVRWEIRPWYDDEGVVGGIVLYSEVITRARQLAAALDESEERYRSLFQQAGVGMAHVARGSEKTLDANEAFCAILGLRREDLLGRTWMELTHPDDVEADTADVAQLGVGGVRSLTREKRFVRPDGAVVWGRVTISIAGEASKVVILEDVTERRVAEQALQESERRLATIFRTSLAGMLIGRVADGRIVDASASFTQLFGFRRDEVLDRTPFELGLFADDDRGAAAIAGEAVPAECRRKDGQRGHFLVTRGRIDVAGEACWVTLFHDVTALRRADEALRASELHLRTVLDLAPVGIVETDPATRRVRWANDHLCRMLGYQASELTALPDTRALVHPDDLRRLSTVEGTTDVAAFEVRLLRRDGSVTTAEVQRRELTGPHGAPIAAIAVVEDVSDRRAREALLRVHTSAFRAAANGIVITDRRGVIESVNPACAQLTGYGEDELVGRNMSVFSSGLQSPRFYAEMWGTILAGSVWRGELVNRRKDGGLYHEEMTITPLREGGEVQRFIAIKQDVSARRKAEDELRASEERYRSLVDNLEDLVVSTEEGGRITFANRAVSLLGHHAPDLLGRPFVELVCPADRALFEELTRDFVPREVRLCDAHGTSRPARVLARPELVDDERVGTTFVAVDLTARRSTEEQLRAAQKMEAIGRLAGGVAHDFNNLLSVILSYTDLAVSDLRPEDPLRADLGEVLEAAKRAEGLTRQLLAFSRKQVMNVETLDLDALVAGLARMLRRLIGEDVDLEIVQGTALHPLRADRGQLEQVLMNLVVNARDALPQGGHVRIETRNVHLDGAEAKAHELAPGDYVRLSVADDGCGMDEAVRQRVFEPFFTTKGVGKGTGLGLSMVYGIVRQSGGAVEVRSSVGAGSVFDVYLPCHRGPATTAGVSAVSVRPRSGHETLLVVEDEDALRALVRRVLVASGYDVRVAANAGEALLLCEQLGAQIQLVLTDVVMPGMSGAELVRRLRPLCPAARVLFMSGYTDDDLERHRVLDPAILRKPFDWRTLAQRVREALDQPSASSAVAVVGP